MKLIRELNLDLDFARMVWPEDQYLDSPCVKYPREYYGRKTVLLAVAEVVLERPLDPLWQLKRCCETKGCRNILHYELTKRWDPTGQRIPERLPHE
jgi:hypothetical protein